MESKQTHNITFLNNDTMIVCPIGIPPQILTTKESVSCENVSIKQKIYILERLYFFLKKHGQPYVPLLPKPDDCGILFFNIEKNTTEQFYMMPI